VGSYQDYQVLSPGYAVARYDRVSMASCRQTVTMYDLKASLVAMDRFRSQVKGPVASLSFTSAGLSIPDGETRAKAAELMRESRGHLIGTATIIEGEGFAASATRAAAAGLYLLSRSPGPYKIFAGPDEVAKWFMTLLDWSAKEASDFAREAQAFRQRHLAEK
jgi:hypothetical protein